MNVGDTTQESPPPPLYISGGNSVMGSGLWPTALSSSIALLLVGSALFYFLVISQLVPVEKRLGIVQAMQRPTTRNSPFAEKIVHFDMKGAAPKINYFMEIFPMLSLLNVTGVLMEYEDMFPYSGEIAILKRTIAYSEDEIAAILEIAKKNKLEVIPLVQTFGHLEFVLKYDRFSHLREDPEQMDTLCPSENESWTLITELLTQVRNLHPDVKRIHIGADEAWQIAKDERCLERLRTELGFSTDRLKLAHIARTARFAREKLHFEEVLVWNDMFGAVSEKLMLKYEMGTLITPVIWGYAVDVTQPGYFPDGMFERYSKVENLRFIVWRIHRLSRSYSAREMIRKQLADLEQKIRHALSAYFYGETVDEFVSANVVSLKTLL
uniref:beta-N-acetylhexosaminidase n=1 Tax=Parascaris univalens TaxID=6257 RepID=A0A915BQL8_PARUN